MKKALIIVESPAKIKTLKKILGANFEFESSYGHVRDLPEKGFGVDIQHNFEPSYEIMNGKKEVIDRLKKAAKDCDIVYLCPDPDREGEAIAWHISQILPKSAKLARVSFQAITKEEVQKALKNPREIDIALVHAQQARRLLDRLVGYTISPLLNRRLKRGRTGAVSAGRVQSVALKLVVDREKEIEAFIPQEYWTITAEFLSKQADKPFISYLFSIDGKKIEKELIPEKVEGRDYIRIANEQDATAATQGIKLEKQFTVTRVEKKEKKRNPEAPFITSTLQQEASRHFRFSPSRTMEIAQTLYEGVDLGDKGVEGLITYMRTDSVRIAPEAITEVRSFIKSQYGKALLPDEVRYFHVKKSAQDAHEAIRPTHVDWTPEIVEPYLSREEYLVYSLIWKRFVASQMMHALYDTVSCDIVAGKYLFRATGSTLKSAGFLVLYEEKQDEDHSEGSEKMLPELYEEEKLKLQDLHSEQSFTRPPPRFTEATLVKELEKSGIGRPSTYAAIMKKIQGREYTVKEQNRLKPTELGRLVTEMLEVNFTDIVNTGFTASMEDNLELVAENKKDWQKLLQEFWNGFEPTLKTAEESAVVPKIMTEHICPKCKGHLQKVWSKSKYFLGCENYPDCDYTTSLEEMTFDKSEYRDDFDWDMPCPNCQKPMKVRFGKFGAFLGCSQYPDCKGIVNIPKKGEEFAQDIDCPAEGCNGKLVQRKSRFGKPFFSCSEFPACDVIGSSVDNVVEKFTGRPQTAYVKKAFKKATSKKTAKKKEEKASDAAPKKKTAPKKKAAKKTTKTSTKKVSTKAATAKKSATKKASTTTAKTKKKAKA